MEDLFRQDRGIALVVALDTALADERYEVCKNAMLDALPGLITLSKSCFFSLV